MTETTGEVELYISAFSSLSMQYKGDIVCFLRRNGFHIVLAYRKYRKFILMRKSVV